MQVKFAFELKTNGGSDKSYHYVSVKSGGRNVAVYAMHAGNVVLGVARGRASVSGTDQSPSGYGRQEVLNALHLFSLSGNTRSANNYVWFVVTPEQFAELTLSEYVAPAVATLEPQPVTLQTLSPIEQRLSIVEEENQKIKSRNEHLETLVAQLQSVPAKSRSRATAKK